MDRPVGPRGQMTQLCALGCVQYILMYANCKAEEQETSCLSKMLVHHSCFSQWKTADKEPQGSLAHRLKTNHLKALNFNPPPVKIHSTSIFCHPLLFLTQLCLKVNEPKLSQPHQTKRIGFKKYFPHDSPSTTRPSYSHTIWNSGCFFSTFKLRLLTFKHFPVVMQVFWHFQQSFLFSTWLKKKNNAWWQ